MTKTFRQNKILLYGDSLTQRGLMSEYNGWVAALSDTYVRKLDVINRGFSGYNTDWSLDYMESVLADVDPDRVVLATILLGTNDATHPLCPQYVPVEQYAENMTKHVKTFQTTLKNAKLIVILPPPLHVARWEKHIADNRDVKPGYIERKKEDLDKYRAAAQKVATTCNVPICDIWPTLFGSSSPDAYDADKALEILCDGLHFNAKGNTLLFNCLQQTIAKHYPNLAADKLEMVTPDFKEFSSKYLK